MSPRTRKKKKELGECGAASVKTRTTFGHGRRLRAASLWISQSFVEGARWAVWGCGGGVAELSKPSFSSFPQAPPERLCQSALPRSQSIPKHPVSPLSLPTSYTTQRQGTSQAKPPPRPAPSHVHRCPPPFDARLEAATERPPTRRPGRAPRQQCTCALTRTKGGKECFDGG